MPKRPAKALYGAAEQLNADGPHSLTQLAAQIVLLEAALVHLADTSPNRGALLRWLHAVGAESEYDTLTSHAVRGAARRLIDKLEDVENSWLPWA